MKFRFSPAINKIKIKKTRKKRLVLKSKDAPQKFRFTETCYPVKSDPIKRKYYIFKQKIKRLFSKFELALHKILHRKSKSPRVPNSTLLGSLCGAAIICTVSAATIIYALFLSYNRPYTSITIPNFVALTESEALALYPDVFEYEIEYKTNDNKPSRTVTGQTPAQGITRKLYSGKKISIKLIVNVEHPTFTLPNLYNVSANEALVKLKSAGINVHLTRQYSNDIEAGKIISCSLPKGTVLSKGDTVTICESLGKKTVYVNVPDLFGLDEYEATDKLKALGLSVGDISYEASDKPIGTVITQSVDKSSSLPRNSKVSFTLSGGITY